MLKEYLSTLANEFRSILGTTDKINAQDFPDKISYVYETGFGNGFNVGYERGKLELLRDSKYMNAKVSGSAIAVNDVSPIGHIVECSVLSKNLFNPYEYVLSTNTENTDGNAYTAYDGSVVLEGGFDTGTEIIYVFTTTEECVLSLTGAEYGTNVFYDNQDIGDIEANSLEYQVAVGTHTLRLVQGSQTSNTIYIQLEKGTTPTPYTPYLTDLSSVEVKRYGKNLLNDLIKHYVSGNVFIGINSTSGSFWLPAGTYTFWVELAIDITPSVYVYKANGDTIAVKYGANSVTFTLAENTYIRVKTYHNSITSVDDVIKAQIELGSKRTDYGPYIEPTTYQSTADGTVDGIKSISPNMTLLTNNNDIVINANYLRDIDTYIDNLITDVALTGGE